MGEKPYRCRAGETTEQYLPAEETDDSCGLQYVDIVPLTRDTDETCTAECDSGDWSAEVKQEKLPDNTGNVDIHHILGQLVLAAVEHN